ncbi:MAG: TolC family protein [Candidatus Acidiferrales bacterium]
MMERLTRSATAVFLAILMVGAPVMGQSQQDQQRSRTTTYDPVKAQQASTDQSQIPPAPQAFKFPAGQYFGRGPLPFPNPLRQLLPVKVDQAVLTNSPKIDQLIKDGKMYLSIDDAISLALENNLDIGVQRYGPWIAQTDLLRAMGGGAIRGSSGTGTATALGSIASASFDPVINTSLNWSRASIPVNNPFISGTGVATLSALTNQTAQANVDYTQGFHTGTSIALGLDNTRSSTTSPASLFNPAVQSVMFINVQQQLLNGFGLLPNTRFIIEAKYEQEVAKLAFSGQVITSVTAVENNYWELVFSRQNVQVEESAVAADEKLYEDNKKQLEIGTMAPLDVVTAQSQLASDQQALIVAQTTQLQQQTNLLNLLTRNPMSADLLDVELVPTTPVFAPEQTENMSLTDAVKEAWQKRVEVLEAEYNLKTAGVEVKATKNALLPVLTLFGQYSAQGLAGNSTSSVSTPTGTFTANLNSPVVDKNGNPIGQQFVGIPVFTTTVTKAQGGLGGSLSQIFNSNFPTYSIGLNLSFPVRNRAAQADSARALLDERQAETQFRQLENTVAVDVRNAQITLKQDRIRVDAAVKARELAEQTLDAEQKKYQLGASTVYNVILKQRDLTTARGNEIRAKADLVEARVSFDRAMGRTLDVNNISMADARTGKISKVPNIPGTVSGSIENGGTQ